jgi:hypothetical protein
MKPLPYFLRGLLQLFERKWSIVKEKLVGTRKGANKSLIGDMRYFFLVLPLFFACTFGYSQKKECPFPFGSIVMADSLTSLRLLDTIKGLQLTPYKNIDKMPAVIQEALDCLLGEKFRVARVGGPYYCCCTIGFRNLPRRQLLYLGVNDRYVLITYKRGGNALFCPMMLFQYDKEKISAVWYWVGFNTETKTKEDILEYFIHYPEVDKDRPYL